LAAVQVTLGSPDWILAKVITHDAQTGIYKLSDEDNESNKSEFLVIPFISNAYSRFVILLNTLAFLLKKFSTSPSPKWSFWAV
jgi:hypothetical protein